MIINVFQSSQCGSDVTGGHIQAVWLFVCSKHKEMYVCQNSGDTQCIQQATDNKNNYYNHLACLRKAAIQIVCPTFLLFNYIRQSV